MVAMIVLLAVAFADERFFLVSHPSAPLSGRTVADPVVNHAPPVLAPVPMMVQTAEPRGSSAWLQAAIFGAAACTAFFSVKVSAMDVPTIPVEGVAARATAANVAGARDTGVFPEVQLPTTLISDFASFKAKSAGLSEEQLKAVQARDAKKTLEASARRAQEAAEANSKAEANAAKIKQRKAIFDKVNADKAAKQQETAREFSDDDALGKVYGSFVIAATVSLPASGFAVLARRTDKTVKERGSSSSFLKVGSTGMGAVRRTFTRTAPVKAQRPVKKAVPKKPVKKAVPKKPVKKAVPVKKPIAKKPVAKKPVAKKPVKK
jgi:hypothetical protein